MKLFNMQPIHKAAASEIDVIHLLHFLADSVKDWECNAKFDECKDCPFYYDINKGGTRVAICILEAIKDCAFCTLEKNTDEYGNILEEES